MLGMTEFVDALRTAFQGQAFTAGQVLDPFSTVPRAAMPNAVQYALARQDRGEDVSPVRTVGRLLARMPEVERVGKTRDGAALWRCAIVLL